MKKTLFCIALTLTLSTAPVCGKVKPPDRPERYHLYLNRRFIHTYEDKATALFFARKHPNTVIIDYLSPTQTIVQKTQFIVENYENQQTFAHEFVKYGDAIRFVNEKGGIVVHISTGTIVYKCEKGGNANQAYAQIAVPLIYQKPELPRGCEVVSLTMMLNHAGINVDKMTLAHQIRKNPRPFVQQGEQIYFGHPDNGFVGDMYSFANPGLGVYSHPVYELAEYYLGNRALHMTGASFDALLYQLDTGYPVWVLTNAKYQPLGASDYQTWHTESGKIQISRWMHSVLVTGYDQDFIYFNDPLGKRSKADKQLFIQAWEQMGAQAVSYFEAGDK